MKHFSTALVIFLIMRINVTIAQTKFFKRALRHETNREYSMAMHVYKEVLYKNMHNKDAKDGLKRSSNALLEDLLSTFFIANENEDYTAIKETSSTISRLQEELKYFDIALSLPTYYIQKIQASETATLNKSYDKGTAAMTQKNYVLAIQHFIEITERDENFKDTQQILKQAKMELLHQQALDKFQAKSYLEAYRLFKQLIEMVPNRTDFKAYADKCIEKGTITMSILSDREAIEGLKNQLKTTFISALSALNNPLLKIVERDNIDKIIDEQKQIFSGLFDEQTTAQLGMLSGAKWILLVKLQDYYYNLLPPQKLIRTAYMKETIKQYDNTGNWRKEDQFVPMVYHEYVKSCELRIALHYKLIEVETGQIILADKISGSKTPQVWYAKYTGEYTSLYPGLDDEIFIAEEKRQEFFQLFEQSTSLPKKKALFDDLRMDIVKKAAEDIQSKLFQIQ